MKEIKKLSLCSKCKYYPSIEHEDIHAQCTKPKIRKNSFNWYKTIPEVLIWEICSEKNIACDCKDFVLKGATK